MLLLTTNFLVRLLPAIFVCLSFLSVDLFAAPSWRVGSEKEIAEEVATPPSTSGARIKAKYYTADTIQALPKLKPLSVQEPEYNKIIFRLEGYPKHKEIILDVKRLASLDPKAYEPKVSFSIQDDGLMLITNTQQRLQNIVSSSRGFLPGERVVYRFRTADGAISKEISGVPTPAVLKTKDGKIALKAELISVNPTVYKIDLPQMKEGEEYDLQSTSLGEITKAKPKYSASTPIHYAPAGGNKAKGGEGKLEIRRKNGEMYTIELPWGTALEVYLQGLKAYTPHQ